MAGDLDEGRRRKIRRAPVRTWLFHVDVVLANGTSFPYEGVAVKAQTAPRAVNRAVLAALRDLKRRKVKGRGSVRSVRVRGRVHSEG